MSTRRRRGTSPSMRKPRKERTISRRGVLGLVLTFVLPPLGLVYLWKLGVFRTRGRTLLTALATVEMMLLVVWMTPAQTAVSVSPIPVTPERVTAAPEGEVLTALSNIDEILQQQQLANAGTKTTAPSLSEQIAAEEEARNAILNTPVYSVYGTGAKYYHSEQVCGNQSNRRQLTVQEAMAEGLGACPDCDPPIVGFILAGNSGDS